MFPPVDASVLRDNPDFAKLHSHLTTAVLHPDGSSKQDPAAKERKRVQDELKQHCIKAAKQHLLTRAIETVTPPDQPRESRSSRTRQPSSSALPEPLLDLLLLLPPLLNPSSQQQLSRESADLLLSSPPLSDLDTLLPDLTALLSSHLRSQALDLARIVHPSTNPSYLHRHIPTLASSLAALADREAEAKTAVTTARLATLASLSSLLADYNAVLSSLIRSLEAKHGPVARAVELDATAVSLQAQRADVDAQTALWTLRREVYTPDAVAALRRYAAHLKDARTRAEERLRGLAAELGEYGVGVEGGEEKERLMREMARVYRQMGREIQDANVDLDRLRRG